MNPRTGIGMVIKLMQMKYIDYLEGVECLKNRKLVKHGSNQMEKVHLFIAKTLDFLR